MRRLLLAVFTSIVLFVGGLGLQPASAAGYPPCTITGTAANETLNGTEGNDVICTGGGNDTVNALGGDDIIIVTAPGVDTINAGSGNDTIDVSLGTDSTIDAGTGDDIVYGSAGDDEITTGDGSDTVQGSDGADIINGGLGEDNLSGDSGNDSITGDIGADTISGGDGNDTVQAGYGNDTVSGGSGDDNLSGEVGNDNLSGDSGNDTLNGGAGDDTISGGDGSDQITGEADIDTITGGEGDDTINAGDGNDDVDAGNGDDTVTGGDGNDDINGDGGNDTITGDTGDDTINGGDGNDTLNGTLGDDTLVGGSGDDRLSGGEGSDSLEGSLGDDSLFGQSGTDTLSGSFGDDLLVGGEGIDLLEGGLGLNVCDFSTGENIVSSCVYDDAGPVADGLSITPNGYDQVIEVGSESSTLQVSFHSSDDSGVSNFAFYCENPLSGAVSPGASVYFDSDLNQFRVVDNATHQSVNVSVEGSNKNFNISFPITIPVGLFPGFKACQLNMVDVLGHVTYFAQRGYIQTSRSSGIYDDAGPVADGLSITPNGYDQVIEVGSESSTLQVSFHSSDDSGVSNFAFYCENPLSGAVSPGASVYFDSDLNQFRVVDNATHQSVNVSVEGSNKNFNISFPITIPVGLFPGFKACQLNMVDVLGHVTYFAQRGYILSYRTPPGIPSRVDNISLQLGSKGTATLSWDAPNFMGSPSLSGYLIEYRVDSSGWQRLFSHLVSGTSTELSPIRRGSKYFFRIRGDNGADLDSPWVQINWGQSNEFLFPTTTPSTARNLESMNVSHSGFNINWDGPEDNGGEIITDFVIEASRNNGQSWQSVKSGVSTSTSLTVSGAAPGTTYLVRVAAVNAVGQSEWLMGSVTTLTTTATTPKNLVSSNLTGTSLSLGWSLPDSNGGSAITDYQVEVTSNGANSWTVIPHTASNSLGFNVTNLLPGRTYQFRVSAVTAAGVGAASNVITVTTLGAVGPNAPASLLVSGVKTNAASLSWSAVVATQKVSNYLVDVSTDGGTWISVSKKVSTSTSLALSGLRLGTTYQVRVAAVNTVGTGLYVYGSFTTLATVSTSPTALASSNISSSGFTLNWNAPSSNGGATITDYAVEINGGGFSWSPISHQVTRNTSIAITGLNPSIKYSVRVKAVNSVGASKVSTTLNVTTLATAPGTVIGLTVKSVTATGAVITWTAPNNGGAKISDYLAETSTDKGQTWKTVVKSASSSTTLTLKGLKTKTNYLFRVSAKNIVGFSAPSSNLIFVTP